MDKKYEVSNIIAVGKDKQEFIDRRTGEVLYFPGFYEYHLAKRQRLKQEQRTNLDPSSSRR